MAMMHDIHATRGRWGAGRFNADAASDVAHRLLRFPFVQNVVVVGMEHSVEALLETLLTTPTVQAHEGMTPEQAQARASWIATLLPGEVALAVDFVEMAVEAAEQPHDSAERRDARAWLQDRFPLYSARVCFEALGVDYEAVKTALVKRWVMGKEQSA